MWNDMWNDGWMMHNWGFGMWLTFLAAFGLAAMTIVLLNILFGRRNAADREVGPEPDDALEILKRRFASGEIDEDEFERRKHALRSDLDETGHTV